MPPNRAEQPARHPPPACPGLSGLLPRCIVLGPAGQVRFCTEGLAERLPDGWWEEDPRAPGLGAGLRDYLRRARRAGGPLPDESFSFALPGSGEEEIRCRAHARPVFESSGAHEGYLIQLYGPKEEPRGTAGRGSCAFRERSPAELERHEKMVALGTLSAGMAHEIGNPLASLSAVVQLLQRRVEDEECTRHLYTLEQQIERITRIVRQMLEFSRSPAEQRVATDLDELVERTVRMVSYSPRARGVRIESPRNRDLPLLHLMPQLFQQVLVNLLLNGLDALEHAEGRRRIRVERWRKDGQVGVAVQDTGVGMSPRQIERAFEPFYTTKPPRQGTGLGLAVSYRLIQRQGGRIRLESTPGQGTVATVSLPLESLAVEADWGRTRRATTT